MMVLSFGGSDPRMSRNRHQRSLVHGQENISAGRSCHLTPVHNLRAGHSYWVREPQWLASLPAGSLS